MKNIFHKGPFIFGGTQKESCPKIIVKALFWITITFTKLFIIYFLIKMVVTICDLDD
jgi:hypothetical protein